LRKNQWNDLLLFEIVPSYCFGPQKYKHKICHNHFTFQHPKKLEAFFNHWNKSSFCGNMFFENWNFWGSWSFKIVLGISWNIRAPKYLFFMRNLNFWSKIFILNSWRSQFLRRAENGGDEKNKINIIPPTFMKFWRLKSTQELLVCNVFIEFDPPK
jgi:hypothetical protein